MGRWIEIPAHRIYEISRIEIQEGEYELLGEHGGFPSEGHATYRVVRQSDGKVFKPARFIPGGSGANDCLYLEEV